MSNKGLACVSVLIPTLNEESDISECIKTASWTDDVHIFDSFSSDRTTAIAVSMGATVHQRKFDGYASQKNAALKTVRFKYEWVLLLDADERVPRALADAIKVFVATAAEDVAGVRMRRRDYLFGKWLKYAQISPFYIRLIRPNRVHFEREVNEVLIPHGLVVDLDQHFDHYPFSKGLTHWIEKHNRYSTMEAARAINDREIKAGYSFRQALLSRDFNVRRFHQKGIFYRLPGRPLLKLFYMLIIRRAVLDGSAGICYALLQAIYEYFIVLKEREAKQG